MTANLVDEERNRRFTLVSGSCVPLSANIRPSASTRALAFCFFLFFLDLLLPRERNRLRKPILAWAGRGKVVKLRREGGREGEGRGV